MIPKTHSFKQMDGKDLGLANRTAKDILYGNTNGLHSTRKLDDGNVGGKVRQNTPAKKRQR